MTKLNGSATPGRDQLLKQLTPHLDEVFRTGTPLLVEPLSLWIVPDLFVLEGQANNPGNQLPATWSIQRADGRTAYLFTAAR